MNAAKAMGFEKPLLQKCINTFALEWYYAFVVDEDCCPMRDKEIDGQSPYLRALLICTRLVS